MWLFSTNFYSGKPGAMLSQEEKKRANSIIECGIAKLDGFNHLDDKNDIHKLHRKRFPHLFSKNKRKLAKEIKSKSEKNLQEHKTKEVQEPETPNAKSELHFSVKTADAETNTYQ